MLDPSTSAGAQIGAAMNWRLLVVKKLGWTTDEDADRFHNKKRYL
jgi:hypothetical protein